MFSQTTYYPPATSSFRPERRLERAGPLDRVARRLAGDVGRPFKVGARRLRRIVSQVERSDAQAARMSASELGAAARALRPELRLKGLGLERAARAFSLVRAAADRTVGMRHFDCQLVGGWALLLGAVAEMETGEGKTLTATLAAATAALSGVPGTYNYGQRLSHRA